MTTLEQEIIERIHKLDLERQQRVLEFIGELETLQQDIQPHIYSARELLKLPLEERNRIIAQAFDRVANDDVELF